MGAAWGAAKPRRIKGGDESEAEAGVVLVKKFNHLTITTPAL